jgi:predicted metal-dependent hydrolase
VALQIPFPPAESSRLPEGVSVQPRRFVFEDLDAIPQYWFAGNPLLTHFENSFSILIPPGERFFIRSVRNYEDRARDSDQRDLVRAFIQQEVLHTSAHEAYNRSLGGFGIDIEAEVASADRVMRRLGRWLPRKVQLGMTVFLEHLTATGAHTLFVLPEVGESMHPEMLRFWRWHAAEELEHKAVAFDLFREIGGSYALRACSALVAVVLLFWPLVACARRMMKQDPNPITAEHRRQARAINRQVGGLQLRLIREYFRPSFHPWKLGDDEYLRAWYTAPEARIEAQSQRA